MKFISARFATAVSRKGMYGCGNGVKQKYLQGDVTDFKDMLAGYKATINIAVANVNICS